MGLCTIYCIVVAFMCGRTACTLARDDIVRACSYQDRRGKRRRPVWKDAPGGHQYKTSYNLAPGSFSPVLVSSKHFKDVANQPDVEHIVMPMKWGLVPRWHKDSPSKVSFKTSNCRGESMLDKATFKTPLQQGHRCVAVMDGFYEWKTTLSGKQPYFFKFTPRNLQMEKKSVNIKDENVQVKSENRAESTSSFSLSYKDSKAFKQEKMEMKVEPLTDYNKEKTSEKSNGQSSENSCELKMLTPKQESSPPSDYSDSSCTGNQNKALDFTDDVTKVSVFPGSEVHEDDTDSWSGHELLTCAAVYDVWQPPHTSVPLYSYSIITMPASSDMSWCHHRMPAVLTSDQEVCDWLDFSTIPLTKASGLIKSNSNCLMSHPVSKNVNNSHYQSQDCLKPVDLSEENKKLSGSGQMMMNWLKRGKSSSTTTKDACQTPTKTSKI